MDFRSGTTWWTEALRIARRQRGRGASDAADDLAQDLAVAALQNGDGAKNAAAWLERVAKNAAIDRWRREDRRKQLLTTVSEPAPDGDPETVLLGQEVRRTLRRAVAHLPRRQRHVAVLRFHGELALDTIAVRLGMPPATVRSRLHRALAALRQQLRHLRATVIVGWPGLQTAALSLALIVGAKIPIDQPPSMAPSVAPPRERRIAQVIQGTQSTPAIVVTPAIRPAPRAHRPPLLPTDPAPVQQMRFDDDAITGDREMPLGEFIRPIGPASSGSLIELRPDLIPEIAKSLEDL